MKRIAALVVAACLFACTPAPEPADPAIWRVEGPDGETAWLFGTIHSLERPANWKTPGVEEALAAADVVMVEIADLDDSAAMSAEFARLASSPGQPALSARVTPSMRPRLEEVLDEAGLSDSQFGKTETWGAALMLARSASRDSNPEYGIDRAVIAAANNKPVVELEGATAQLALFDALPEAEQRDLLEAVLADMSALDAENADLAEAWRKGDMQAIEAETRRGLLADPELRAALFTGRNAAWRDRIEQAMAAGRKPFVAVGAAHMAGSEGLPAMLADAGYQVTRIR